MPLSSRHLIGLEGIKKEEIELIFRTTDIFKEVLERPIKKVPTLTGKTIVNLFFEPSTRTRISFELAERRLSADTVNFTSSSSSLSKGETLKDTVRNIEAMKIDMVVVRHSSPGTPLFLSKILDASIINAGDGAHEHPTQGLLDMYSLRERFGNLNGLQVLIVGDISHSRVALSNIYGMTTMGINVSICGPATLIPRELDKLGVKIYYDLNKAVKDKDVILALRLQLERQKSGLFPSIREYRNCFGITREILKKTKSDIVIMHPGPINRGIELDGDIADSEYSIILNQVANGVAIRMAVLYLLSGVESSLTV